MAITRPCAPARAACKTAAISTGMMAIVVVDGDAVPAARELEAAFDPGERRECRADRVVGDARFAGGGDGGQRVERIVLPGIGTLQPRIVPLAAASARAEIGIDDDRAALLRQPIAA